MQDPPDRAWRGLELGTGRADRPRRRPRSGRSTSSRSCATRPCRNDVRLFPAVPLALDDQPPAMRREPRLTVGHDSLRGAVTVLDEPHPPGALTSSTRFARHQRPDRVPLDDCSILRDRRSPDRRGRRPRWLEERILEDGSTLDRRYEAGARIAGRSPYAPGSAARGSATSASIPSGVYSSETGHTLET